MPSPKFGGMPCPDDATQSVPCNIHQCPRNAKCRLHKSQCQTYHSLTVDGSWSSWAYTSGGFSKTCGNGTRVASRTCDEPAPQHGGMYCAGNATRVDECFQLSCPIHGGWGEWEEKSPCSATCGTVQRQLERACDSPPPQHGGTACQGDDAMPQDCSLGPCPINGNWGEWSESVPCSMTCGTDQRTLSRQCDSPAAQHGGQACQGDSLMTEACTLQQCPVDGVWTAWTETASCLQTCGVDFRTYGRTCTNPAPEHGGQECVGSETDVQSCPALPDCSHLSMNCCPICGICGFVLHFLLFRHFICHCQAQSWPVPGI